MRLEEKHSTKSRSSRENLCIDMEAPAVQCTETHAYIIPHLGLNNIESREALDTNAIKGGSFEPRISNESIKGRASAQLVTQQKIHPNLLTDPESIEILPESIEICAQPTSEIIHKAAQFIYGCDLGTDSERPLRKSTVEGDDERETITVTIDEQTDKDAAYTNSRLSNRLQNGISKPRTMDHIYEDIEMLKKSRDPYKYDILDYYERYSPRTAKTLIRTLFLPRHRICKQCATLKDSPVYTDRLVYLKKLLFAKEVTLLQLEDCLYFKFNLSAVSDDLLELARNADSEDYMPVCSLAKTNSSGILYSHGTPQDIFDLKSTLEPNIVLKNNVSCGVENTQLYHRMASNYYCRISEAGCAPMIFQAQENIISLSMIKGVGYETDLQNWMNYRNNMIKLRDSIQDELPLSIVDSHPNRASLLLLEPLLLMPELTDTRGNHVKNRISRSEHVKIVRMMIAYTLAFFSMAILTFYIVYFT